MNPWAKIRHLSRLFSEYAIAQAFIQLLGVIAGLWLVNLLPLSEYALYTLALSIFTFLSVFSDLGISSALLYFRRETRIAQAAFAPYVRAALMLRHGLLIIGAGAALAFIFAVGPDRGFRTYDLSLTVAVLIAAVWVQIGASTALLQLRLEGIYRESYLAEMLGNALRLLGVGLMWLVSAPLAWLAMLTGAAGSLMTGFIAARHLPKFRHDALSNAARSDPGPARAIARYVLPMSLSAVYFSIQGPLTVWLSAYFAGTNTIAEVGALGRLGIIFSMVSGFMGAVLIPRLSVVTDDGHYLRRYLQFWVILAAFGVGVVGAVHLFPHWLLLLLGEAYRGLESGVVLVAISSVLSTWGGYVVSINSARGWVRHQHLIILLYAAIQVAFVATLDLSTTNGVLLYGIWSGVAGLLLQFSVNVAGFLSPELLTVRDRTTLADASQWMKADR